jgi:hypothetical protein
VIPPAGFASRMMKYAGFVEDAGLKRSDGSFPTRQPVSSSQ